MLASIHDFFDNFHRNARAHFLESILRTLPTRHHSWQRNYSSKKTHYPSPCRTLGLLRPNTPLRNHIIALQDVRARALSRQVELVLAPAYPVGILKQSLTPHTQRVRVDVRVDEREAHVRPAEVNRIVESRRAVTLVAALGKAPQRSRLAPVINEKLILNLS